MSVENGKKNENQVVLSDTTVLKGTLHFKQTLCIRGKFSGTIQSEDGDLIVDKGAFVEADIINVSNLTVYGTVHSPVHAEGRIDLFSSAVVRGDLEAGQLRISDGALFEGKCSMVGQGKEDIEIFSRPTSEIKAELNAGV